MVESMAMRVLYNVLLTIGARERWSAARSSLNGNSSVAGWMMAFGIMTLVGSVILVVWIFIKHGRSENLLRQKVSELTINNKKLQREIAGINREVLDVLENVIDVDSHGSEVLELNDQQIKALSELSQRLQQS